MTSSFKPISFGGSNELTPVKLPSPIGYSKNYVSAESTARNDKRQRDILIEQAS
jgi:hypothetical protein